MPLWRMPFAQIQRSTSHTHTQANSGVPNTPGTTTRPLQLAAAAEDAVVDTPAVVVVCIQLDDMHAHQALVARFDVPGL